MEDNFIDREKQTSYAHTKICNFVGNRKPFNQLKDEEYEIDEVKEAIAHLRDKKDLLECSTNGYNLLFDIVHLPYQSFHGKKVSDANEKSEIMLGFILKRAQEIQEEEKTSNKDNSKENDVLISFITNNETKHAHTPLHAIILSKNTNNLRVYLEMAKETMVREGEYIDDRYSNLIFAPNEIGFTPLQQILFSGHPQNMELYLKYVEPVFPLTENKKFTGDEATKQKIHDWLLKPNNWGFTPLHTAIINGNLENLQRYFQMLEKAIEVNIITREEYYALLLQENKDDFTPLQQALKEDRPEVTRLYLAKVQDGVEKKGISSQKYGAIPTINNRHGFNSFHTVLQAKEPESLKIYAKWIQELWDNKHLNKDQYRALILSKNTHRFTTMHQVVSNGNVVMMREFFNILNHALENEIISKEEMSALFSASNLNGDTPLDILLRNGKNVDALKLYFAELETIAYSSEEYNTLFTHRNHTDHTPMHQAANSGSFEICKTFADKFKEKLPVEYPAALHATTKLRNCAGLITPYCNPKYKGNTKEEAERINKFLDEERASPKASREKTQNKPFALDKEDDFPGLGRPQQPTSKRGFFPKPKPKPKGTPNTPNIWKKSPPGCK